jgi:hypothetical protein
MQCERAVLSALEHLDLKWLPAIDAQRLDDRLLRAEPSCQVLEWLSLRVAVLKLPGKEQRLTQIRRTVKALPQTGGLKKIDTY